MTLPIPETPEDCLADCAHLFPDRHTENSYGDLLYRMTLVRIEMLVTARVHEAAIRAIEESHAAAMKALTAPLSGRV